jgi:hypothetical protein
MKRYFGGLTLAAAAAILLVYPVSCGEDTCRIVIDAPAEGDPIDVSLCASCNKGKDPQEEVAIEVEFLANDPDVGCRCLGATCVFCIEDCEDEDCEVDVQTDEGTGCIDPTISLELDQEDFPEGTRLPVTVQASSLLGETTLVVHLVRPTATPTPTVTPTETANPTTTPTPTPTSLIPLPI